MHQRFVPLLPWHFSRWLIALLVLLSMCVESLAAPLASASSAQATLPVRGRVRLVSRTDPVDSSKYIKLVVADNGAPLRGENPRLFANSDGAPNPKATDPDYWRRLAYTFRLNTVRVLIYREPQAFSGGCGTTCTNFNTYSATDADTNKDGVLDSRDSGKAKWDLLMQRTITALDQWVNNAAQNGFYVIVDYHPVGGLDKFDAREWWKVIAPRYKNHTHVIYELANEPVKWNSDLYTDADRAFQREMFQYLRDVAPDTHIILWSFAQSKVLNSGGPTMLDVVRATTGIDYSNASVGFHIYSLKDVNVNNLKRAYPVIQSEMGGRSTADYDAHVANMERLGISSWILLDGTYAGKEVTVTWPMDPFFNNNSTLPTPTRTPTATVMPTKQPTSTPVAPTPEPPEGVTPMPTPIIDPSQTILVNFRSKSAPDVSGSMADIGQVFGDRGNGLSYGWDRDNTANARYRSGLNPNDLRLESFVYNGYYGAYVWEIALPNGIYNVRLVVGDPKYPGTGTYITNVEGQAIVSGKTSAATLWLENTLQVRVTDGRLTVTNGNGSKSNVLNLIEITPIVESAPPPHVAYQEQNGLVVIEAENAMRFTDRSGYSWRPQTDVGGFAGPSFVRAEPEQKSGAADPYSAYSPSLEYTINFTTPGRYYVWVRAFANDSGANSLHLGWNGAEISMGRNLSWSETGVWVWTRRVESGTAQITVDAAGQHTLNVWMREDGARLDRLILTTDPNYTPTDNGPAESLKE
jgi:hypothetical protein